MRRFIIYYLLFMIYCSAAAAETAMINSFSKGEITDKLGARTDVQAYYSACRELTNMYVKPWGGVEKRPGTYYIATVPPAGHWVTPAPTTVTTTTGEYPTLQELTAAEIPDAPAEPADTALAAATDVNTPAGLQSIAGAGHYNITDDIDLVGVTWTPITNFSGVIEGNDYTISNLTISNTSDVQGLFASLSTGAEIRNLNFLDCSVSADDVVGLLAAKINDSAASVRLKNITFTDCTLQGQYGVGMLVGQSKYPTDLQIYNCDVINPTITVNAASDYAAPLCGLIQQAKTTTAVSYIVDCNSQGGTITAGNDGSYVAGFIGLLTGFVAGATSGGIYDCYTTTDIVGAGIQYEIAGFTGKIVGWDAVSCYATGDIDITYTGSQTGGQYAGGFAALGEMAGDYINCYATGNITIDASGQTVDGFANHYGEVGGFIGDYAPNTTGDIIRCYATGNITYVGDVRVWDGIGGFIGRLKPNTNATCIIERSWSVGDITLAEGDNFNTTSKGGAGAFAGEVMYTTASKTVNFTIQNCYGWGSVLFTDAEEDAAVGGFIGTYYATQAMTLTLDNCYDAQTNTAAGSSLSNQLTAGNFTNGFIGWVSATTDATVTNSFWDTDTSDIATDTYAVGHITSWMQTKTNYEAAGWDFTTIWILTETSESETTYYDQEYVEAVDVDEDLPRRLISFDIPNGESIVIEAGNEYMRFLK